jgi:hypothetical protein
MDVPGRAAGGKARMAMLSDAERKEFASKGAKERWRRRKTRGNNVSLHPLLVALIDELPEPDAIWDVERRAEWLQLAAAIFRVIYPVEKDDKDQIIVRLVDEAEVSIAIAAATPGQRQTDRTGDELES